MPQDTIEIDATEMELVAQAAVESLSTIRESSPASDIHGVTRTLTSGDDLITVRVAVHKGMAGKPRRVRQQKAKR